MEVRDAPGRQRLPWIRRPVRREGAERYLLVTLVSFAATVIVTRWFLALTGFPQIGGGDLHIAHALWGGAALFAASILPILLAGRFVYLTSALLAGVGIGLFIDEVGKFISAENDYFYPAAAPIIYATFLIAVLVWLRARRPDDPDPRSQLLTALELFEESVEGDLQRVERDDLRERLAAAAAARRAPNSVAWQPTCSPSWTTKTCAWHPTRSTGSVGCARVGAPGATDGSAGEGSASCSSAPSWSAALARSWRSSRSASEVDFDFSQLMPAYTRFQLVHLLVEGCPARCSSLAVCSSPSSDAIGSAGRLPTSGCWSR